MPGRPFARNPFRAYCILRSLQCRMLVRLAIVGGVTGAFWVFEPIPAPPLTVTLLGPNGVEAEITVPVEQDLVPVELTFRPTETGPHAYRLQISPLDNERFLANNEASLAIDVRQERASLLLGTDRPGWDARFLAQAAVRESRLSLKTGSPELDTVVKGLPSRM